MKALIYGVGVIGSLTAHALCRAGNDVTLVARGQWKQALDSRGLKIRKFSGSREWTDHPRILDEYDGGSVDVVFSVMQNQQQWSVLDALAKVRAKRIVLVGNNLESTRMQEKLKRLRNDRMVIFFAFQTSGGQRYRDYTQVVSFGRPEFVIGCLVGEPNRRDQDFFRRLFRGSPAFSSFPKKDLH